MSVNDLTNLLPSVPLADPMPGARVVSVADFGAARGDAMRVLELLTGGKVANPTDITEEIAGVNHRYARELLGMLTTHGLARVTDDDDEGEDGWIVTDAGRVLAQENERVFYLNQNGAGSAATGHKETKMATKSTKTAKPKAAKAAKNSTPSAPRYCGCGCGDQVNGKSIFRQGHDARMVSQEVAKVTTEAQIAKTRDAIAKAYSGNLALKFELAATNKLAKATAKAERASKPKAEKAPKAPKPGAKVTAKVGRWTKEGHLTAEGDLVTTNAKGQEQIVAAGKFQLV